MPFKPKTRDKSKHRPSPLHFPLTPFKSVSHANTHATQPIQPTDSIPLQSFPIPLHRPYTHHPTVTPGTNTSHDLHLPSTTTRRRPHSKWRWKWPTSRQLQSFLYQSSFTLSILIISALLIGAAWGIAVQAWRNGRGQRRWNIVVVTATYVALAIVAVIHVWSRLLTVKKILRTMPKPYIPIKQVDIPRKVADHIMTEYTRTAVIAHISQATTGQQEGWGRPGTRWENQHFRTVILSTLPTMRKALCPSSSSSTSSSSQPLDLSPLLKASSELNDNGAIRLFVNSYIKLVEKARYSRREPDEVDAGAVERVVEVVLLTLEMRRRRLEGEAAKGFGEGRERNAAGEKLGMGKEDGYEVRYGKEGPQVDEEERAQGQGETGVGVGDEVRGGKGDG